MENLINIIILTLKFCMYFFVVVGVVFIILGIVALVYLIKEKKSIDDKFNNKQC